MWPAVQWRGLTAASSHGAGSIAGGGKLSTKIFWNSGHTLLASCWARACSLSICTKDVRSACPCEEECSQMAAAVRANAPHKALARSIQKAAGFRALPERRLPGSSSALRTCIATLSLHYTPPRPFFLKLEIRGRDEATGVAGGARARRPSRCSSAHLHVIPSSFSFVSVHFV